MDATMQDVPLTIASIMRHACAQHADRTITTATGDGYRHTTIAEIGQQAGRLANALRRLGITGDQRVGTFMWNNAEHLTAYLAVPSMGAVLHTLNIRLSAEQIAYIANEAEDQVVIADLSLVAQLAPVLPLLKTVHTVIGVGVGDIDALSTPGIAVVRYDDVLAAESPEFDWPDVDERSAAAMCYTSGTTGHPKGVVYSHRSSYLHAMMTNTANAVGVGFTDKVLPIVPVFHANAWGMPYGALMAGAAIVMTDRFMDSKSLIDLIETQRPTIAAAVPTIWNDVLHCLEQSSGHDISSLRLVTCGGSAVPISMMKAFEEQHGVQIVQAWGMTETSPLATIARPLPDASGEEYWRQRATQGRVVAGVEARIVDDEGNPLPHDNEVVGEVQVRGPWITGAYYRNLDAEKFDNGWLRTGDVGRIDKYGYVTLTDRAKDVIKSGGEWISSVELENHLMGHPAVSEAAVVAVPDERWQERPLAVVVVSEGVEVCAKDLRDFLGDKVVRWWLPERWAFVDAVPLTSVGKFDKKTIRARYAENAYKVIEQRD